MIILKTMRFSNLFSYGADNVIYFDKDPITQLVGKNGHGKSSIALILEEALFNKNSKGIKKADILNRHGKAKSYAIDLEFEKDGDTYEIKVSRSTTQTVGLFKNGNNISAHTATATFRSIEEILGFDHKTFSQLVYQSNSSSLEFLTATDTNRKKFLIDLLNLSKYVTAFDIFKAEAKTVDEERIGIQSKVNTFKSIIEKNEKEDLVPQLCKVVPPNPTEEENQLHDLKAKLADIDSTNKKIVQNNTYREQLESIPLDSLVSLIPVAESDVEYVSLLGGHRKALKDADNLITKIGKLAGTCPTCLQQINRDMIDSLIKEQSIAKLEANEGIRLLDKRIKDIAELNKLALALAKRKNDWETYHSLVDYSIPSEPLNADEIEGEINRLNSSILNQKYAIDAVIKFNTKVAAHNSKVTVILDQMKNMESELETLNAQLLEVNSRLNVLQILQKTFSTNGLLAYKIECLVKDLEVLTNEYLTDLSSGRFQLTFKVNTGDKLNVIITDNGRDIEILALSGGERARVNTATLLAIRKLMQSLSNARINLLILDETVDTLDGDGKEKLIEVLLKEQHLNTFLVSHGFTHPLLEKINVVKENNISRLE